MAGICGWLGKPGETTPNAVLLRDMLKTLGPLSKPSIFDTENGCLGAVDGDVASLPDGLMAAIVGHFLWADPHIASLAKKQGDAVTLAHIHKNIGDNVLKYLRGSFCLAVQDTANNQLFVAIDRIGQEGLYYTLTPTGIVFGTKAASIRLHPLVSSELSEQSIFDYVYFHMVPSPNSIYAREHKLPGAHYLDYRDGHVEIVNYWQPDFSDTTVLDEQALGEEMRGIIRESVNRSIEGCIVGAFLSGGLDSSTLAGMLAQLRPGKANTYSIGFAEEDYDETGYARITARHFHTNHHEYYVTPDDVANLLPLVARSFDEPFGNSSVVPLYYCAKLAAKNGVNRMLAGDGGDELFAGNSRYAKQLVFARYHRFPSMLRKLLLEPIAFNLPNNFTFLRKAQSYIHQANIPLPERLQTYNFLHQYAPTEVFESDFLAALNPAEPLRLQKERYEKVKAASELNRMMYLDWQTTLADNDLRKVNQMCTLAGVDVVYPFLEDTLVEFSCRVPSHLKIKGKQLRYFYKQAMRDFLPRETLAKSKHGFGLPFGIWMRSHQPLQEQAYDSLLTLKKRHFFTSEFIDKCIQMHRKGHAAYYGELVWILMMLEMWLQAHADK